MRFNRSRRVASYVAFTVFLKVVVVAYCRIVWDIYPCTTYALYPPIFLETELSARFLTRNEKEDNRAQENAR